MTKKTEVEKIAQAAIDAMAEFAPIYGVNFPDFTNKDYVQHVVASLINDKVIQSGDTVRNVQE